MLPTWNTAQIVIVDDESANVLLLQRMLQRAGYSCITSTTDPREVPALVASVQPDIILLDLMMPYVDGFMLMEQLRPQLVAQGQPPILVLTADANPTTRLKALSSGARDFVTKPFDRTEVLLRIKNLLEMRSLQLQLQSQNRDLEAQVHQRTALLEDARQETLVRLARAAEYRDDDTGVHTMRVGDNAGAIATMLGWSAEEAEVLRQAAPLHDVGKIGIADAILLKPGKLTPEEFATMQGHTLIGANILSGSRSPVLQVGEVVARAHHERWDGTGYPAGLRGDAIPWAARIVMVVDIFDALTHDRPYKTAWPVTDAMAEIQRLRGTFCDPTIVDAFQQALAQEQVRLV